jgi:hypothetical protein
MENIYYVVEYKTDNEMFKQKFVYTSFCDEFETMLLFINDSTAEELRIRKSKLEYWVQRPIRNDEL